MLEVQAVGLAVSLVEGFSADLLGFMSEAKAQRSIESSRLHHTPILKPLVQGLGLRVPEKLRPQIKYN